MARQTGYTMLELLVALSLMSLIGTFCVYSLSFGREVAERQSGILYRVRDVRNTHERLREWLERAIPVDRYRVVGRASSPMVGSADYIEFVAALAAANDQDSYSRVRIGYDRQTQALMVEAWPDWDVDAQQRVPATTVVLVDGLERAEFSYKGWGSGKQWSPTWSSETDLPGAVRLQLELAGGGNTRVPDLMVTPLVDGSARCDYDPASRSCRPARGTTR